MKKHLILTIAPFLLMLLSFTNAVAGTEIIVIRIYENNAEPMIVISNKEKSTQILLETGKKQRDKNGETISKTLEQYYKEGYKIESATAVASLENRAANSIMVIGPTLITTYILIK